MFAFQNMGIGKRFFVSFAVILGLMVATSVMEYMSLVKIRPLAYSMYADRLIPATDLGEMSHHWFRIQLNTENLLSTRDPQEVASLLQASEKELQEVKEHLAAYEATYLVEAEIQHLDQYRKAQSACLAVYSRVVDASRRNDSTGIGMPAQAEIKGAFGKVIETVRELVNDQRVVGIELYNTLEGTVNMAEVTSAVIALVSLMVGFLLSFFLARSVTRPLKQLNEAAHQVANGDWDAAVAVSSTDEIGSLAESFNRMVDSVRSGLREVEQKGREAEVAASEAREALENITRLTEQVRAAAGEVAQYTGEISTSAEQMAAGAEEQASQTAEVAAAAEEMAQTITETSRSITVTAQSSEQAGAAAQAGMSAVSGAKASMETIVTVTRATSEKIDTLTAKVEEVGSIAEVINEIADQTNLLALNAAIEAARAGTHGRGFAVVADEVRKLAERTAKATKEISIVLKSIQVETHQARESMEQASDVVERELASSTHLTSAFERISVETGNVTMLINQIAASSEEQSSTMSEVSKTIEGMRVVAEQSAVGVNQIAQATTRLNDLMENLQILVNQFSSDSPQAKREPEVSHRSRRQAVPARDEAHGRPVPRRAVHNIG